MAVYKSGTINGLPAKLTQWKSASNYSATPMLGGRFPPPDQ